MFPVETAAEEYIKNLRHFGPRDPIAEGFIKGADWAYEHARNSVAIDEIIAEIEERIQAATLNCKETQKEGGTNNHMWTAYSSEADALCSLRDWIKTERNKP